MKRQLSGTPQQHKHSAIHQARSIRQTVKELRRAVKALKCRRAALKVEWLFESYGRYANDRYHTGRRISRLGGAAGMQKAIMNATALYHKKCVKEGY